VAGVIVAAAGEGWCFLIDGVSYFAVIASLLMMRIERGAARRHTQSMLEQMREGWDYVRGFRPIRVILTLFAVVSLMGWPYAVLLPMFAGQVLHGGAHTLGWLTGASGIGALVSAASLAMRKTVVGLTRMIQISAGMFGAGLVLFGMSHVLWLSLLLLMFVGFGMMQCAAGVNTVVQSLVSEDKRGRVMSYYTMAFVGSAPFGSLLAGMLAHKIGAPHTVMITGGFCMLGAVWFAFKLPAVDAAMRPVYEAKGLLPADDTDLVVEESSAA
jgi:MFS family permease